MNGRQKLWAIAFGLIIFANVFDVVYTIVELEIATSGSNSMQRLDMILAAVQYFMDNPFFGLGASNYILISPYGTEPHSAYALILAETGLFGALSYFFLLLSIMLGLFRNRFDGEGLLLFMLMTNILVLGLFTGLVASQIALFIFIGMYLGKKTKRKLESRASSLSHISVNSI